MVEAQLKPTGVVGEGRREISWLTQLPSLKVKAWLSLGAHVMSSLLLTSLWLGLALPGSFYFQTFP